MYRMLRYSVLACALLILGAGCPWLTKQQQYTSAATSSSSSGPLDTATGGTTSESNTSDAVSERAVLEPDVIRRDGNLLYVLNQYRGLTIVNLDTQKLLAQVPTYGFPRDLYLAGKRAYVLVGYATQYAAQGNTVSCTVGSKLYALNIADPANTAIMGSIDLEGDFVDSRMVGDVLYAVSARYQWYWTTDSGGTVSTNVTKDQTSDSWVTSVNTADPAQLTVADTLSLSGYGSVIQATSSAIFVAAPDYSSDSTSITYVDISDPAGAIAARGAVTVMGQMADQYKMDAYNGVLRVVTGTNWPNRQVIATTVDLSNPDSLAVLGETSLESAAGETLYATRFDGPRAYIVSYYQRDPLFVLDLSDPVHPALVGELEVPGWSTYIEPLGDRLLALGVDDTNGWRVCVSLFDVADPAKPALLDRKTFGDAWSWSSAYSDVDALTVMDDMVLVPFSGWSDSGGFERLQFVSMSHDALTSEGYVDLQGQVLRSFQYNSNYYCVTTEQLAQIDASDLAAPTVTHRLTLAEYLADYLELSPDLGAEIVSKYDAGTTVLRTETLDGEALGELEVKGSSFAAAHAYGDKVVLVFTDWDGTNYRYYYRVVIADCTAPETPAVFKEFKLDVQPYWSGYYYYDAMPVTAGLSTEGSTGAVSSAKSATTSYMPWYWWPSGDNTFVTGNILSLRCSADSYDVSFGSATPQQGLALVNLDTGEQTHTVGLGYDAVNAINVLDGKLYLSTANNAGTDLLGRAFVACYIQAFDPAGPAMGAAANVPGTFVQYDPASGILVLEDTQFPNLDWSVTQSLKSVSWTGGSEATLIDSLELPSGAGLLKGRGAHIYYDLYDQGTVIASAAVSGTGQLSAGDKLRVTDTWAYLIDADANSVYTVIAGGAVARYDFSGTPTLTDLVPVMNAPQRIRFGAETAYAPLGYAGLLTLPR